MHVVILPYEVRESVGAIEECLRKAVMPHLQTTNSDKHHSNERSKTYVDSDIAIALCCHIIKQLLKRRRLRYIAGTWHPGEIERLSHAICLQARRLNDQERFLPTTLEGVIMFILHLYYKKQFAIVPESNASHVDSLQDSLLHFLFPIHATVH